MDSGVRGTAVSVSLVEDVQPGEMTHGLSSREDGGRRTDDET